MASASASAGKENQKCRRADIFHRGYTPCFCVCRGNKGVAGRDFVCRGNKRLGNDANWSDKETGISPHPGYPGSAGIIRLTGGPRIRLERRSGQANISHRGVPPSFSERVRKCLKTRKDDARSSRRGRGNSGEKKIAVGPDKFVPKCHEQF